MELPAEPATFARAGKRGGLFFALLLWVSLSTAAWQGVTAERSFLRLGAANQALALAAPAPVSFADGPAAGGGGEEEDEDEEQDDEQEEQTESSETAGDSSLAADSDDLIETGDAVAFDQASDKAPRGRKSPSPKAESSTSSGETAAERPSKEFLDRIGARAPVDEDVHEAHHKNVEQLKKDKRFLKAQNEDVHGAYHKVLEELKKDKRFLNAQKANDEAAEERAQRIGLWMAKNPAPPRGSSPLPEKDPEAKRKYDEVVRELKEKFAKNAGTPKVPIVPEVLKGRPRK